MRRFLMRRLIAVVPTILIVTGLVYALVLLVPGRDPAVFLLGDSADPALLERFHQELGLNDPIYVQYGHWLLNLAKGDLGRSIRTNERLTTEIRQRMGVTIELAVGSLAVALVIALPIGVWSAVRPNSLIDNVGTVFAIAGAAIPNFWLGILLIYLFAVSLGWLPAEGYVRLTNDPLDNLKHMIMPMVTAGTAAAATITRQTRAAVMEVLRQDYIRTARAKGLSQRLVITRHALKNSLIPVVTVLGLITAHLLSGTAVTETIFRLPGVGDMAVQAAIYNDIPTIQAALLLFAAIVLLVNLAVDIAYAYLDPRIKYG